MRRVVVTGMGIVSCMGNSTGEVLHALREGMSGLQVVPEMQDLGYRCPVAGLVRGLDTSGISKRALRTMGAPGRFAAVATLEALQGARLAPEQLRSDRAGVVVGSGGGGVDAAAEAEAMLLAQKNPARVGATGMVRILNSTAAVNLAAWLGVRGRCYSVASACCSGTDSIGHGFELIRHGVVDICICGAAEGSGWRHAWAFGEASGVRPPHLDGPPHTLCRPYDRRRQGMLDSEGAGILVLESLEHAERRGAPAIAEVIGYGSANDGETMFGPTGRGLERAIRQALRRAAEIDGGVTIDYINPHGAGTRVGDPVEVRVIRSIFTETSPLVSSTKPLNGHSQGAAGAHEAIFVLLMLRHGFVVPTPNLESVDPECDGIKHVRSLTEGPLRTVMSFNAGLGGTNACVIFRGP